MSHKDIIFIKIKLLSSANFCFDFARRVLLTLSDTKLRVGGEGGKQPMTDIAVILRLLLSSAKYCCDVSSLHHISEDMAGWWITWI